MESRSWGKGVYFVLTGALLQLVTPPFSLSRSLSLSPLSRGSPPPFSVKTNLFFCSEPETIESTNVTTAKQGLLQNRWGLLKPSLQLQADYSQMHVLQMHVYIFYVQKLLILLPIRCLFQNSKSETKPRV